MGRVVIIGAGLTGLSAAYHCEQKNFFDYTIFEKEGDIGGLCRSVYENGFTFDYTGHLLHINDTYFRSLIESHVGLEHFNAVNRRSFIYSHGTYTAYPFQVNLKGLPAAVITECVKGFVQKRRTKKRPGSFKEWVLAQFGKGFGKHFFFPYQRKIFDFPVDLLSASWTGRFVPATSLEAIINGIAGDHVVPTGYNANFLYPKTGGIISWVKSFARSVTQPIKTLFCVSRIDIKNKWVEFSNGHCEHYDTLITTMPLDQLLNVIVEPSSVTIKKAADYLLCNSVVNFNLGIAHPAISSKHWIYFPEKKIPFYRIGFPHNFSPHAVPDGCSSLYGEFSYLRKPQARIEQMLKESTKKVKELLGLAQSDILVEKIIHIPHAYVIYDAWRDVHISKIHAQLQEYGIYSVGRYGEWKYSSMQEAVLDGKQVVDTVLKNLDGR